MIRVKGTSLSVMVTAENLLVLLKGTLDTTLMFLGLMTVCCILNSSNALSVVLPPITEFRLFFIARDAVVLYTADNSRRL